jgi:hypothetical protein
MAALSTDEAAANLDVILNEWKLKWMIGSAQQKVGCEQERSLEERVLLQHSIHTESQ